jgi:hypothetical protein
VNLRKHGCDAEVTLEEKATHEAACSYAPLKCKYAARGCAYTGTAGDLNDHLRTCPYEQLRGFLDSLEVSLCIRVSLWLSYACFFVEPL